MSEIKKQLELNGYVFIPSHFPDEETLTSMSNLGEVLHITNINQKQTLIPIKPSNSNLNTYSGNYGLSAFPLHTDLAHWVVPPRYFALRCVKQHPILSTNQRPIVSTFLSC